LTVSNNFIVAITQIPHALIAVRINTNAENTDARKSDLKAKATNYLPSTNTFILISQLFPSYIRSGQIARRRTFEISEAGFYRLDAHLVVQPHKEKS